MRSRGRPSVAQAPRLQYSSPRPRTKAGETPALLLGFYADDLTGSTDALEQLTLAGIRTVLFIEPPTRKQLAQFGDPQAIGVAGMTRSMTPVATERELRPALQKLKALKPRHVHYKVCSTFDSSPTVGSIGRVIDVATEIFRVPFVPVLAAAPALGRFTVFGNHFARYGIGSTGAIHRLDRHPSISRHPITPMTEADLRLHLAKQTGKEIRLVDILKFDLPEQEARAELETILNGADIVLFDAITPDHLRRIGRLIDGFASNRRPLFSVGSSGIETALGSCWKVAGSAQRMREWVERASPVRQALVGSGSCSPVTGGQIAWALKHGYAEVHLRPEQCLTATTAGKEIQRATDAAVRLLRTGRSVIVHTTRSGAAQHITAALKNRSARILGTALGEVLRRAMDQSGVRRLCVAGGDTSSYAARALGIEAMEMIARLTPGAPLCRASAPGSPVDGAEIVFKGGQVGPEDYFEIVCRGRQRHGAPPTSGANLRPG